jgi:hypothetical protein
LYKKIAKAERKAEIKNEIAIVLYKMVGWEIKSITKTTFADVSVHILHTRMSPPEISPAKNKYNVCIL